MIFTTTGYRRINAMMSQPFFLRLYILTQKPGIRVTLLTLYYLAILVGLILMYGRGNFTTPSFIYQGF